MHAYTQNCILTLEYLFLSSIYYLSLCQHCHTTMGFRDSLECKFRDSSGIQGFTRIEFWVSNRDSVGIQGFTRIEFWDSNRDSEGFRDSRELSFGIQTEIQVGFRDSQELNFICFRDSFGIQGFTRIQNSKMHTGLSTPL